MRGIMPHWAVGKVALGFGVDQMKTLVAMATFSSHRLKLRLKKKDIFSEGTEELSYLLCGPIHKSCQPILRGPNMPRPGLP